MFNGVLQCYKEYIVKSITDFFENTDFSYLKEGEPVGEPYQKIWEDVYLPSQQKKAAECNISEEQRKSAFNGLSKRGRFLCDLYSFFECKNIAEVGTAEGFQFFTFCNYLKENDINGKVYTCDIRDVRNSDYKDNFDNIGSFVSGTSTEMSNKILEDDQKIDLFWIDGSHQSGAVLFDVIRLAKTQSKNAVWVFDDFDERFGIHNEIGFLSNFSESYSFSLGCTASGNPNTMMILAGTI